MKSQVSLKTAYQTVCEILRPQDNYLNQATELVCHFAKCNKHDLIVGNSLVDVGIMQLLIEAANKRKSGYPLQYILGEWDFYGQTFLVGEGVLIPRSDTEVLVDVALEYANCCINNGKTNLKILDLCSGTGCVAITLKKHIDSCTVYALEKSEKAIEFLKKNIALHQCEITVLQDDALCPQTKLTEFDIIVSNPPYLTRDDMNALQTEVTFEPEMALYGQEDGLYFYKELTRVWTNRLAKGGLLAYEIGINQHESVGKLLKSNGYDMICNQRDLCDIIRVVSAVAPAQI